MHFRNFYLFFHLFLCTIGSAFVAHKRVGP